MPVQRIAVEVPLDGDDQELVLQHLIDTREPTEDARVILQRLRDAVAKLTAGSLPPDGQSSDKAA